MDEMIETMLKLQAMGSFRNDESVARQAVMNHTTAAHFADMGFIRDALEPSTVEAFALQGLAAATLAAQAAGYSTAARM